MSRVPVSMKRIWMIGAIAAALLLLGTGIAQAGVIASSPGSNTYAGGPFHQAAGEISSYANPAGSLAPHNVVAVDRGPDGEQLFASGTINPGGSAPLPGTQYLAPGTYDFVCTLHDGMADELIVSGGTPAARPEIGVTIPRQKLKKVRKSGTLAVDVEGVNDATGVSLEVSKGAKTLGTVSDVSVPTGTTRTVSVKLTRAGKKAIKTGKKAAVVAEGSLAFGKSVTAKRTLR